MYAITDMAYWLIFATVIYVLRTRSKDGKGTQNSEHVVFSDK